ncbi:hypothetical protein ACJBU6_04693 [Exserohilum turcicum]
MLRSARHLGFPNAACMSHSLRLRSPQQKQAPLTTRPFLFSSSSPSSSPSPSLHSIPYIEPLAASNLNIDTMPPKKDTGGDTHELVAGFTDRETKLLAAAFLSSTAPDKYDYDLMAALTNNTTGSLKKMCKSHASINKTRRTNMPCSNLGPIVKRKAIDSHSSFAKFMGHSESADGGSSKSPFTPKSKKRKVSDDAAEEADESDQEPSESEKKASKGKKPAVEKPAAEKKRRGRPKKQPKTEEVAIYEDNDHAKASEGTNDEVAESEQDKFDSPKVNKPAAEKPAVEKKRRGRPKKQPKSEEAPAHEDKGNAEDKDNDENSADGGDGLDAQAETAV